MSTINSSDYLLVSDTSNSNALRSCTFGNRNKIQEDDLLMVYDASHSNHTKCTYADWAGDKGEGIPSGGQNIYSSIYSPTITVDTQTSSGDSTNGFRILNQQVQVTSNSIGYAVGDLYVGHRINASTTYYSDMCIGAVQIISGISGTLRREFYCFFNNSAPGTTTSHVITNATTDPSTLTYSQVKSGSTKYRWNQSTSTGSSRTGANNGISDAYGEYAERVKGVLTGGIAGGNFWNRSSVLPASGTVPQSSGEYYWYVETSGTTNGRMVWMQFPLAASLQGQNATETGEAMLDDDVAIYNGDYIRIAYLMATSTSGGQSGTNSLYLYFKPHDGN